MFSYLLSEDSKAARLHCTIEVCLSPNETWHKVETHGLGQQVPLSLSLSLCPLPPPLSLYLGSISCCACRIPSVTTGAPWEEGLDLLGLGLFSIWLYHLGRCPINMCWINKSWERQSLTICLEAHSCQMEASVGIRESLPENIKFQLVIQKCQ